MPLDHEPPVPMNNMRGIAGDEHCMSLLTDEKEPNLQKLVKSSQER